MQVVRVTMAVEKMAEMVHFYNAVFGAGLAPIGQGDLPLYKGRLGGLDLLFCPNAILQIQAEKNNLQLSVEVDSLERAVAAAEDHGGGVLANPEAARELRVGIVDPDGNTIELVETR
jgi:predicted enzyme related to lactoylglutathione lyase